MDCGVAPGLWCGDLTLFYQPSLGHLVCEQRGSMEGPHSVHRLLWQQSVAARFARCMQAILDSYTGILQGLHAGGKAALLQPHLASMGTFLGLVSAGDKQNDDTDKAICGVLGDLAQCIGAPAAELVKDEVRPPFYLTRTSSHICTARHTEKTRTRGQERMLCWAIVTFCWSLIVA